MSNAVRAESHKHFFMGAKLQPRQGVYAGLFAGVGMMLLWLCGAQIWGPGARMLLISIGGILPAIESPSLQMILGLLIHFLIAVGLGVLFAVSLDRLDNKDTLIVSTFYGFTIWVVSVIILRHWLHVNAIQMSRSWWGFLVFLFFGFLLGVYANLFGRTPVR